MVKETLGGLIGTICKGAGAIAIASGYARRIDHAWREQPLRQLRHHSIGLLDMKLQPWLTIWWPIFINLTDSSSATMLLESHPRPDLR